jgi:TPP-dependent pyruvate/acetoin dehydrogenase alpha subunit
VKVVSMIDPEFELMSVFRSMLRIRFFEELVQALFVRGLVPGTTHLCQGQEAISVGAAAATRPGDAWTYTYRGHGQVLARGMDPAVAFAEIMGRSTGCNRGKGGSMHLTDAKLGLYGSFAIVGAGLPVAVGLAKARQLEQAGSVSITFFGDGAANIGAFHEALNLAAVWRAPVVFVCENNLYGEYTRINKSTPIDDIAVRGTSYGMPAAIVDGNDVRAVFIAVREAARRARDGKGPTLLECKTYRQRGHSRSDAAKYRPAEEVAAWMARDPIDRARSELLTLGVAPKDLEEVQAQERTAIEAAAEEAARAPWPTLAELTSDVY